MKWLELTSQEVGILAKETDVVILQLVVLSLTDHICHQVLMSM